MTSFQLLKPGNSLTLIILLITLQISACSVENPTAAVSSDAGSDNITVIEANHPAVISGIDSGVITEDNDPDNDNLLEVAGQLDITDSDIGEAAFIVASHNGNYGVLEIDAAGNWSYAANNQQAAIQNLAGGAALTDRLTVSSIDGTTHAVVITINGIDETAPAEPVSTELTVSSYTPSFDAVDVALNSTIRVFFNSALIESSINATSVKLVDASNATIAAVITHSNGILTIDPVSALEPLTQYTVSLSDTLKNTNGNTLPAGFSWRFITQATSGYCDPLPPASGNIITVDTSQSSNLDSIVASLNTGDTLLLEDGTYNLNGVSLWFNTPGVTMRSVSGNPEKVILDGGYVSNEIVTIAASNVTIAEITIKRAYTHPIHVTTSSSGDTKGTLIYRTNIIDAREQAIKINPGYNSNFADNGTIACSSLLLTDTGRQNVNNKASPCYTGGIDAHKSRDWIVRDNRIEGFWCPTGLAQHAINFWTNSRDTEVKRNVLVDNARGVGFGLVDNGSTPRTYADNPCPQSSGEYVSHYGGIIKNNFIFTSSTGLLNSSSKVDCSICLWSACEATVVHNTVFSKGNYASIEMRYPITKDARIYNNLANRSISIRDGASGDIQGNIVNASGSLFVGGGTDENLHLSPGAAIAIDKGYTLTDNVDIDIDGDARDAQPDIGADEIKN